MALKECSAPEDDDGEFLQLVSDSAPFWYNPKLERELHVSAVDAASPSFVFPNPSGALVSPDGSFTMRPSPVFNTSGIRFDSAGHLNLFSGNPTVFADQGSSLFINPATAIFNNPNPSIFINPAPTVFAEQPSTFYASGNPTLHTDQVYKFGVGSEVGSYVFKNNYEPGVIRLSDSSGIVVHGDALNSYAVPQSLHVGTFQQDLYAGSRAASVTFHDPGNVGRFVLGHDVHHFNSFDAYDPETGIIRTGIIKLHDSDRVVSSTYSFDQYARSYNEVLHIGRREWGTERMEISEDGTLIIKGRTEGLLANPYTLTLPAAACVETTIPNLIVWERPRLPWIQVSDELRFLIAFLCLAWAALRVAPRGRVTQNQPLESHDREAWSLAASPARSKIASVRLAA